MNEKILACLFIFMLPVLVFAKTAHHTSHSKKKADEKKETTKFEESVYIDGSYNYLVKSNEFVSHTFDRVFDINENGFTLQQAGLTLAFQPKEGFGFIFTPVIGRDTYIFAPYGWNPDYGYQWFGFALPQAYIQFATGPWTFMVGSFIELAGAENIFSYNDTNFSRAILWGYAEPFTVLGLRVSYIPNDKLTLYLGINNGWDSIRDISRHKTIELGISYIFNKIFSLASYIYAGEQRIADRTSSGPTGFRMLFDLIATINATEKLSFVANYDGAFQKRALLPEGNVAEAVWQGVAGYINYKCNEQWRASIRGEVFSDRNGYRTGVAQAWKEVTLTLAYAPIKDAEIRAETRRDFSNTRAFFNSNHIGASKYQQSYAIEGYYKFSF